MSISEQIELPKQTATRVSHLMRKVCKRKENFLIHCASLFYAVKGFLKCLAQFQRYPLLQKGVIETPAATRNKKKVMLPPSGAAVINSPSWDDILWV